MLQEDSCIVLEVLDTSNLRIIDTIDLTKNNTDNVIVPIGAMDTVSNIMDEQLTCSVCSELFIKATTLNCMHTFCFHCIDTWNKKRKECPVCRASVKSMNRSLVLDNFIEKMLDKLSMHMKDRRAEIVEEREGMFLSQMYTYVTFILKLYNVLALEREKNVHKEQEIE